MKLFQYIESEMLSGKGAVALDHSTAVSGNDNQQNIELGKVTERFITLLEEKDRQIDRLLTIIETRNTDK